MPTSSVWMGSGAPPRCLRGPGWQGAPLQSGGVPHTHSAQPGLPPTHSPHPATAPAAPQAGAELQRKRQAGPQHKLDCIILLARLGDHSQQQALSQHAGLAADAQLTGRGCSAGEPPWPARLAGTAAGPQAPTYPSACPLQGGSSSVGPWPQRQALMPWCSSSSSVRACPLQGSSGGVSGWQRPSAECELTATTITVHAVLHCRAAAAV